MFIIDFFCQGIGIFEETFKVSAEGKSLTLHGRSSAGKSLLKKVILSALYEEFFNMFRDELKTSKNIPSKCALTFRGKTAYFRIMRDFKEGKVNLFKYEPSTKKFVLYTSDSNQVNLLMTEEGQLPDGDGYKNFFIFEEEKLDYPFKKASFTSTISTVPSSSPGERAVIEKELEKAKKIKELEFRLDALERELFELDENKGKVKEMIEKEENLKKEIEKYKTLESLPPDIQDKIERFSDESERVRVRLSAVDDRLREEEANKLFLEAQTIFKSKIFWLSILLFVGGAFSFLSFSTPESLLIKLLPLLSVFGFLGCVFSVWKEITRREKIKNVDQKIEKLQNEKKSIKNEFDIEFAIIPDLMKEFSLNFPEEINEIIEKKKELERELEEIKTQVKSIMGEINPEDVEKREKEIRQEIDSIKKQLDEIGPLSATEEELRKQLEGYASDIYAEGEIAAVSEFESLFQKTFHRDFSTFLSENEQTLSNLLGVLTGGKWRKIFYEKELNLASENSRVPFSSACSSEKSAVRLALLFTLRAWAKETFPVPVILDCPETFFDEDIRANLSKLLGEFSKRIQMIVFFRDKNFKPSFEKHIDLKG